MTTDAVPPTLRMAGSCVNAVACVSCPKGHGSLSSPAVPWALQLLMGQDVSSATSALTLSTPLSPREAAKGPAHSSLPFPFHLHRTHWLHEMVVSVQPLSPAIPTGMIQRVPACPITAGFLLPCLPPSYRGCYLSRSPTLQPLCCEDERTAVTVMCHNLTPDSASGLMHDGGPLILSRN